MTEKFIRSHIRNLTPYQPILPLDVLSQQLGVPMEDLVKLDANENPYGMPPSAQKRLAALDYAHIYPDPESRRLRNKLAEVLDIPMENILAGTGADELIDLIVRLTLDTSDQLIDCPPTFGFYDAVAQINALQRILVPRNPDFSLDLEGIRTVADAGAKVIFLTNPNNPDGSLIPRAVLEQILEMPLLVVLDEAYIHFAPPETSLIKSVLERDNLIVLRTFSKWGGLAGLRLGYGVFPVALAAALMKIKPPYNVSVAAQEAGLGALDDLAILNQRLNWILAERSRLFVALDEIPWLLPYPTHANFILCRVVGRDAAQVRDVLATRGILIRYFNKPRLQDHIRFSIGKPEDTDRLLAALKEINL